MTRRKFVETSVDVATANEALAAAMVLIDPKRKLERTPIEKFYAEGLSGLNRQSYSISYHLHREGRPNTSLKDFNLLAEKGVGISGG